MSQAPDAGYAREQLQPLTKFRQQHRRTTVCHLALQALVQILGDDGGVRQCMLLVDLVCFRMGGCARQLLCKTAKATLDVLMRQIRLAKVAVLGAMWRRRYVFAFSLIV